ncbi:MAG: hypothetical protein ACRCY3_01060 [Sphingorhabdus sp.]
MQGPGIGRNKISKIARCSLTIIFNCKAGLIHTMIYFAATFLILIFAYWRGSGPEKSVAFTFAGMMLADPLLHGLLSNTYQTINFAHLCIDSAAWLSFVLLALYANRLWTFCVASLQTIALSSHAVRMLSIDLDPQAYGIMQVAASYPVLLLLAIGTWRHRQRLLRYGGDRSWSL